MHVGCSLLTPAQQQPLHQEK